MGLLAAFSDDRPGCGSYADAGAAVKGGVDPIGTTLAGATGERPKTDGPDLELLEQVTGWFKGALDA